MISPLFDGRSVVLVRDYEYEINGYVISVPKGFVSDLASVPRMFWSLFPPFGKYTQASIIHDYLYSKQNDTGINKILADKIFLFVMKECGVGTIKRNLMYQAVKMFGEASWKTKDKNEGYKDLAVIDRTEEANKYYCYWRSILNL